MSTNIKEEARRLIDRLPEDITWDDLMHEIYVRQSIQAGLDDSEAGKTVEISTADAERDLWVRLSSKRLEGAYGQNEDEYTPDLIKEANPEYEGR